MTKPNLFILGAQKCGTSWLHANLARHPDIFMSEQKELAYFNGPDAKYKSKDPEAYFAHFAPGANRKYRGESTPAYFWTRKAHRHRIPRRVCQTLGKDLYFIVILRNPIERAISAFYHHAVRGRIESGLSLFDMDPSFGVLDIGHYSRHLKAWQDLFPKEGFLVAPYDDLKSSPYKFVCSITDWLGLPPMPDESILKRRIHSTADIAKRNRGAHDDTPVVGGTEIAKLHKYYAEEIEELENLLGWDLTKWRDPSNIATTVTPG